MPLIQYSSKNVIIKIDQKFADKDFYAKTILASSLSNEEKERLLKEAGLLDSVKGLFGGGGSIPDVDFKSLWSKESPGGQFSGRMIAWKKASESGNWNPKLVLSLLQTMSAFSTGAQAIYAKNKPLLEAMARGVNTPAIQKGWNDLMSSLGPSLTLIKQTTPSYYTGAGYDRQTSQFSHR